MKKAISQLKVALRFIEFASRALVSIHTDDHARDDREMAFLEYVDEGLRAIIDREAVPAAPAALAPAAGKLQPTKRKRSSKKSQQG